MKGPGHNSPRRVVSGPAFGLRCSRVLHAMGAVQNYSAFPAGWAGKNHTAHVSKNQAQLLSPSADAFV